MWRSFGNRCTAATPAVATARLPSLTAVSRYRKTSVRVCPAGGDVPQRGLLSCFCRKQFRNYQFINRSQKTWKLVPYRPPSRGLGIRLFSWDSLSTFVPCSRFQERSPICWWAFWKMATCRGSSHIPQKRTWACRRTSYRVSGTACPTGCCCKPRRIGGGSSASGGARLQDWASLGYSVSRDCEPAYIVSFGSWQPVFNGSQIHPRFCPAEPAKPYLSDHVDVFRCREFVGATGAEITSDPSRLPPHANPSLGVVRIPASARLISAPSQWRLDLPARFVARRKPIHFYNFACHELLHWSEVRLNWHREMDQRELAAEMGAGLLANLLQVELMTDRTNANKYVRQWMEGITSDLEYFLDAARQAERAAEFLLLKAGQVGGGVA